ncbi:methylated-DNA--[protein]-cysteine S-methyltransferase [Hydrogenophaga sp. A37]|uniref:methylated-DNA--[protein]-cysteine S-methyltransferase n=1 Tax=Hydrogenophaga sp. A37 TaxID=1945864 RepID=UPI00098780FC|nr:methylated-DNA--[protein]-cysteine S-methyltransferase [Hydrogenophaga sp. A37]OOG82365.1 cysteine methyltransferase [Hydrogenophaga sp. A37]
MASLGHALFDTVIGACGIAWGSHGITAVQLPEPNAQATRARLLKSAGGCPEVSDPPDAVRAAITGIQALLNGEPRQLLELELDLERLTPFQRQAYAIARAIPPGQTRTYGEIAQELGDPSLARAVGQAMGHNPFAPVVPCHRVLAAGQKPGGFSASGGALTKLRMLAIEGAVPGGTPSLFDDL